MDEAASPRAKGKGKGFYRDLRRSLRFHMVDRDLREAAGLGPWLLRQLRIFWVTLRSFGYGSGSDIRPHVGALTYNTLLAIVPLLVVAFSLFKAFGGLRQLEEPARRIIVENLAVGAAEQVSGHFEQFIENINAGALGTVGFLVLVYSVLAMMINVENAFNSIWGVRHGRPLSTRLTIYWALVTLGPVLFTLSISLTVSLQQWSPIAQLLGWSPAIPSIVFELLSMLVVTLAFAIMYYVMPHTRVRRDAAAMGGLVASILWHLTKNVYLYLSTTTFRYSAIYGALGALPIFILWIYLSWFILLFGVRYSYLFQQGLEWHAAARLIDAHQRYRELLGLRLCVALTNRFRQRRLPAPADELAEAVGAPLSLVIEALQELSEHGLVIEGQHRGQPTLAYSLNSDPHETTAAEVIAVLRTKLGQDYPMRDEESWQVVRELLDRSEEASQEVLEGTRLLEIAEANGAAEDAEE